MARVIICDICDENYIEKRHELDSVKVELKGKTFKVYVDINSEEAPDYNRLDICSSCRKQTLMKVLEQ